MNGQVPVSGAAWTRRVKERRERWREERMRDIHRGVATTGHYNVLKSHLVHCAHSHFTPSPLSILSYRPILGTDVYTDVIPHGNHLFLPSPISTPPPSPRCALSLRTLVAFRVGVRGYRTGSSSLRGEPPSWWRANILSSLLESRLVVVKVEGESARRTQIGQFRLDERICLLFFPYNSSICIAEKRIVYWKESCDLFFISIPFFTLFEKHDTWVE